MRKELPKVYDPRQVEPRIYQMWMDGGCFKAEPNPDKKPFSIVMPPPNVTGQLHMGHAMDATLQDILIRFKRMQGYEALWLPGTDHAGIATQIKVEENLRQEGLTRYDLGREKFLERVWAWKEKYGNRIVEQQKKMGSSCDWDRSRFTMDEGCSRAVRETFCELYDKGLIYKGSRIINWCPHCVTALSDAEVEYQLKQLARDLEISVEVIRDVCADEIAEYIKLDAERDASLPVHSIVECYTGGTAFAWYGMNPYPRLKRVVLGKLAAGGKKAEKAFVLRASKAQVDYMGDY